MKRSSILEARRKTVSPNAKEFVSLSFGVVDRTHFILESQNKTQKELANLLDKSDSEISKWMRGNHNFTLDTIAKIQVALGEKVIEVAGDSAQKVETLEIELKSVYQKLGKALSDLENLRARLVEMTRHRDTLQEYYMQHDTESLSTHNIQVHPYGNTHGIWIALNPSPVEMKVEKVKIQKGKIEMYENSKWESVKSSEKLCCV